MVTHGHGAPPPIDNVGQQERRVSGRRHGIGRHMAGDLPDIRVHVTDQPSSVRLPRRR
ncbi:hypothetical protein I553_3024 [Mycobacterium xenopi 4042]|uniref:Uncharacterized protein n=1 Tax=Mycobacterium xenopi 4042 TaxID=1299334 RepID=X7ZM75_MYCXE|nr:hypothetical protein I553_3024 [Mycobacterium xenopi 4042]